MSGKPTRVPAGFLNARQVAQRAREMGFSINAKYLVEAANAGKVPFGELQPGRKKGLIFPKSKLIQVIAASPKEGAKPDWAFTAEDVYKIAKQKGISVQQWHIFEKISAILAGRAPLPGTISQDLWHNRHRYFFSQGFVRAFLKDGIRRKNLPQYLQRGLLVSLEDLGERLGISDQAIFKWQKNGKLKTHLISKRRYVTLWEAERFSEWYKRNMNGTHLLNGGKARAKQSLPKGLVDWRTKKEAEWWLRNVVLRVRDKGKRKRMEALISTNMHLSHNQFKAQVLPQIDELLKEKKKSRPDKF